MATTNLGRVRFNMRGDYTPDADPLYSLFDLVSDGGGSFVYINDTPSNEPTFSTSHWQQIASVGGQDLVDAAVAARNEAQGYKDAAAASATQLAAGTASPAGTYANLTALNADTAADVSKIYITLDEGNWCYHNGTTWVAGGVYQAFAGLDKTLTVDNVPAESKAVGDAITGLFTNDYPEFDNLIDWGKIVHQSYWNTTAPEFNDGYWRTDYFRVVAGVHYAVYNKYTKAACAIPRVVFFDDAKNYLSALPPQTGGFTAPVGAVYALADFRYMHGGPVTTYTESFELYGADYDDGINKIIINQGTHPNITLPYDNYLSPFLALDTVNITAKVVTISDAARGRGVVQLSPAVHTGTVIIRVCGSNIFDGVLQTGYYGAGGILLGGTTKTNVNPIVVNGGSYINLSKNCRVSEFDSNGVVLEQRLASARLPFLLNFNTAYIHFHGVAADMDVMYINAGKNLTASAETYVAVDTTVVVGAWRTAGFDTNINLFEGVNNVFVVGNYVNTIKVTYNRSKQKSYDLSTALSENVALFNDWPGTQRLGLKKFVSHRGSSILPENTIHSTVWAILRGFKTIECDVRFTSDNIPVLLHDPTIDRTSNGTGNIVDLTFAAANAFDYGTWKSSKYPTGLFKFETFVRMCKMFDVVPYIDLQTSATMTNAQALILYNIVDGYGMLDNVIWASATYTGPEKIMALYNDSEHYMNFGFYTSSTDAETINSIITSLSWFRNVSTHRLNEVIIGLNYAAITPTIDESRKAENLKLNLYTIADYQTLVSVIIYDTDYYTTESFDIGRGLAFYFSDPKYYLPL